MKQVQQTPEGPESPFHPHVTAGRSRAAFFGVIWSALHALVPTLSSAAVFFISALFLTPQDFGTVGLASGMVSFAIAFSPVAFGEALVQRSRICRRHADSLFWASAVFAAALFAVFLLGAPLLTRMSGEPGVRAMLPVLALRIPFELLAVVPNAMIIRAMKFKLIALRTAVAATVSGVVSVAMLLSGFGYWALVASQVLASAVICLMAFSVARWRPGRGLDVAALKDLWSYGSFASADRMLNTMKLDHILLGALAGTHVLGLYYFGQRLFNLLLSLVGGALSSVTHVLLSSLQDDLARSRDAFMIASYVSSAVSFPMFSGLALIAPELVPWFFGAQWAEAVIVIQGFCVVGMLASIGIVQGALVKAQGRVNWWFYYQLAQHVGTFLVLALGFGAGLRIMMLALIAKFIVLWPISIVMTARLLKMRPSAYVLNFARPLLAMSAMTAAVMLVSNRTADAGVAVRVAGQIAAGALVYSSAILALSHEQLRRVHHMVFPARRQAI